MHLRCKQAIPIYQKWYEHKTSSNAVYLSLNVNAFWHICSRGSWMRGKLCKFSNCTLFQNWTASCYQRRNTRTTTSNWNLSFLQTHFKNIVIKEEIANNEQFIHLPQCLSICPITDSLGWCSGRVCASDVGGRGFDPRPGHTKDLKNGSNDWSPWRPWLWGLALRLTGWCQDKCTLNKYPFICVDKAPLASYIYIYKQINQIECICLSLTMH